MASKPKQPVLTRQQVERLIAPYLKDLPVEKYPLVAFGIRGLYGPNKRGEWDDGTGWMERTENGVYAIFPGNTDPTAPFRKGLGCLSSGQILWFKIGLHKGRKAFRQAATFLVDRDGIGKRLKAGIGCAFNWHDSTTNTTSSLGCQTNPKDVFPAVRELGYMLVRKYYPKTETFPYILVDADFVAEAKATESLKIGDRGEKVKFLQLTLGIKADGIFGQNTEKAVIAFQKKSGLVADGVVGKKTAAALAAPVGEKPTASGFDFAFTFVLGNEGGYSNHPADKGGPTNWGIIQSRYSEYLGRPASVADVKAMTKDTAKAIYKKYYWDTLNLDGVNNEKVATAIFDQGVNRGTGTIARAVQKIVKVTADGEIGPKSLKAINAQEPGVLINKIADNAEAAYKAIVAKNPSQKVFLKGWLNRANHVRGLA